MPVPAYDRPELRPEGFNGVSGKSVPHPMRPQPQPSGSDIPKDGQGGGNNGKGR